MADITALPPNPGYLASAETGAPETRLGFTLWHWCLWQSTETPSTTPWSFGQILPCNNGLADVGFLPMIQSRRLSPLARAACSVVWNCKQQYGDMPSVFFSSHGESQYYYQILQALAAGEDISPTRFSLCVHNAIAGLSSFHSGSHLPYISLAGGNEGLFAVFLEASGILAETTKVLVVCYEQALPESYGSYITSGNTTWALAMVLGRDINSARSLRLTRTINNSGTTNDNGQNLIQSIVAGKPDSVCYLERAIWQWSFGDDSKN
jgi:hypothetical protein